MDEMQIAAIVGGLVLLIVVGYLLLLARSIRRVDRATALIVNRGGRIEVRFADSVVVPVLQRAEVVDLGLHAVELDCRGKEGIVCADCIRADITATFYVRINRTAEDVLKIADTIGCARATDPKALRELLHARFAEALKSVGKGIEFAALCADRQGFKDQVIERIGRDLNGYVLDDVAIAYLEQTPLEALDPNNVLDAVGIRKITELTTREGIRVHALRQEERLAISAQNLSEAEESARIERRRAEQGIRGS